MSNLVTGLVETFQPAPQRTPRTAAVTARRDDRGHGLVDAFSYLVLGHVFVANMTGNVVFLGFALAGAPGFSITASFAASRGVRARCGSGGRLYAKGRAHRGTLFVPRLVHPGRLLALGDDPRPPGHLAGERRLPLRVDWRHGYRHGCPERHRAKTCGTRPHDDRAHADHHRHVADLGDVASVGPANARRLIAILSMFVGGLVGAVLVLRSALFSPLLIATILIGSIALVARLLSRGDEQWHHT